jgi:hypothetical protein
MSRSKPLQDWAGHDAEDLRVVIGSFLVLTLQLR